MNLFSVILRKNPTILSAFLICISGFSLASAEVRTWESNDGKKIQAKFLKLDGEIVHLKLQDGKLGKVPLSRFSQADQDFLKNLTNPEPSDPRPATKKPPISAVPKQPITPAPPQWPNEMGDEIPSHLTKEWVYPPGTSYRSAGKWWNPTGEEMFVDKSFRANSLDFINGYAISKLSFKREEAKPGLINPEGDFVIGGDNPKPLPPNLISIGEMGDNGLIPFAQKSKKETLWGFMNLQGEVVIAPKWHVAKRFSNGLAAVSVEKTKLQQGRSGMIYATGAFKYINKEGEIVIDQPWFVARPFSDCGHACVRLTPETGNLEQWLFVRKDGSQFTPGDFMEKPQDFRKGRLVTENRIYDTKETAIFKAPRGYRLIAATDNSGVCILTASNRLPGPARLVDQQSGKCYGPVLNYHYIAPFSEALALFSPDGKTGGFINRSGEVVIEPTHRRNGAFKNGYLALSNS